MNTTKAKKRLTNDFQQELSIEYSDGEEPADGDEVLVYGKRFNRGREVDWRFKEATPAENGFTFDEDKGHHQLVLRGVVSIDNSNRPYTLESTEIYETSPVEKCKEEIKEMFVQLRHLGWPTYYVTNSSRRMVSIDDELFSGPFSALETDHIQVTTVRSDKKAMHLGISDRDDSRFKLGVNWSSWHRKSPTQKVKTLTHELVHCTHPHHKESFYTEHARLISNITSSEARKEHVESLFDAEIQWNKLKTLVMKGVHRQPKEIDTSGFEHRRAACNAVVKKLEDILDYSYDMGMCLHLSPPTSEFYTQAQFEYAESDKHGDFPSRTEWDTDETVELRRVVELDIDDDFTDEELFNYLKNGLKREPDEFRTHFVYDSDDLPVVDEDGIVTKGHKLPALFKRMINESNIIVEDGFTRDVEVPVITK